MSDIIKIAYGEPQMALDNEVMKAVCRVGISVNKEELVKALELSESLVRCKECRNLYIDTSDEGTSCYWCGVWANATDENSFCSHGKRKDEPQTGYKKWDVPPKVDIPTVNTNCVSVLASALEDEPQGEPTFEEVEEYCKKR